MPSDAPFFVFFAIVVLAFIVLAIVAIVSTWQPRAKGSVTPVKASLPPLYGGYKARTDGSGRRAHPKPPKAPKGAGGGSH